MTNQIKHINDLPACGLGQTHLMLLLVKGDSGMFISEFTRSCLKRPWSMQFLIGLAIQFGVPGSSWRCQHHGHDAPTICHDSSPKWYIIVQIARRKGIVNGTNKLQLESICELQLIKVQHSNRRIRRLVHFFSTVLKAMSSNDSNEIHPYSNKDSFGNYTSGIAA